MAKNTEATSLTANQVEELANQVFKEQRRDALIITVFQDKKRAAPHWLVRWSETGITRQASVDLTPGMTGDKFRGLLVKAIANAPVV
jgi:hypothetical protein